MTVTGTIFKARLGDDSATATQAEYSLDTAIDLLNAFDAGLSEMTGATGSRTGTYTSKQAGAIWVMAREVYRTHWKNADGTSGNVGAITQTHSSDPNLLSMARQLADKLNSTKYIYRT